MLNKKYRLPADDIALLARKGKLTKHELFDTRVWYDDDLEYPLFGISISKHIDNRAVIRNLIKRKLRAAIKTLIDKNSFKKGKYLFIVRSVKLADADQSELETILSN